jgi:hypothetical protein
VLSRPAERPADADEQRTEREEPNVPPEGVRYVVPDVVNPEEVVVDHALDEVERPPPEEQ